MSLDSILLSVIIPCYNEEKRIEKGYSKLTSFLKLKDFKYEIVAVNDGSKDNTLTLLNQIASKDPCFKVISYDNNKGKGGGVKEGLLASSGKYVCFIDVDMAVDLDAINLSLGILQQNKADIVIANRRMKGSVEKTPFFRKLISLVNRLVTFIITGLVYPDTQCGFKVFKHKVAVTLAQKQIIEGFSFDVEYLYIAKLLKLSIAEIPVISQNDTSQSSVRIVRDSFRFIKDLFRIRFNKHEYSKNI